jgi:putative transposase
MKLVYKYRAYPNKQTAAFLTKAMFLCRQLWNDALQERLGARKLGFHINLKTQLHQLPSYKKLDPAYLALHPDWPEDVIIRLDDAYRAFFAKYKSGRRPPKFSKHLNSIRYTRSRNFQIEDETLVGKKLPSPIRFVKHRPLSTSPTSCSIKQEADGRWFLCFIVEEEARLTDVTDPIGIDLGISHAIATNDGRFFDLPKCRGLESKLKRYQRKLARQKRGSNRRADTKHQIAKLHGRITRLREQWMHKITAKLSDSDVALEDLNLKGLKRGMLSAEFQQNPLGKVIQQLRYKTELKGKRCVSVDPKGTSQTCICGAEVRKKLSQRIHRCGFCGVVAHRDTMAAMVILARSGLVTGPFKVQQTLSASNCQRGLVCESSPVVTQSGQGNEQEKGLHISLRGSEQKMTDFVANLEAVADSG